ncbi:hypothetical protein [Aeromonas jandaei]|uniref:hypothetical protein n=1 Tax=Aeromonas jandaei TaxID=650 RepID=UPI003EC84604
MKKYIAVIVFYMFTFFFHKSVFAATTECFRNLPISGIIIGFSENSVTGPNGGNAISFTTNNGKGNVSLWGIDERVNLDDGGKGLAMYQSLNMAMALRLRVSAWDHDMTPGGVGSCRQIDEIRLHSRF